MAALICLCICSFCGLFWLLLGQQSVRELPTVDSISFPQIFEIQLSDDSERSTVYQLSDKQLIAPAPDPSAYGQAADPADMQDILSQAHGHFAMDHSLFTTSTPIKPGSSVLYYLDDSLFVVTWKQVLDNSTYTFSEIKIMHPSQIRRFFSDGRFGSGMLKTTTEMAQTVNAVVASSGDYYEYRSIGVVVNDGQVFRHMGHYLDTCFVDDRGDLLFSYAGDIKDAETAQAFVDEHNVRFSLSFGPVMIENGEYRVPANYNSGEINDHYARAALCQMDERHYVLVTANMEEPNYEVPTVSEFAYNLLKLGIPKAYALDGGQTAAIAMDGELINTVSYGSQREISDILYFATAIPKF